MRDKWIHLKVTETEREQIKELAEAGGMTVAELIRTAVRRVRPWTLEDRDAVRELSREIAKVGNLLNQVARHANTYAGAADRVEIILHLQGIESQLTELYKKARNGERDAYQVH